MHAYIIHVYVGRFSAFVIGTRVLIPKVMRIV